MPIIIKKFSKKAVFSLALTSGIFLAFIVRIFLGAGHVNLSRLDSSARDLVNDEKTALGVNAARADIPSPPPGNCGGDSGDSSGGDSTG